MLSVIAFIFSARSLFLASVEQILAYPKLFVYTPNYYLKYGYSLVRYNIYFAKGTNTKSIYRGGYTEWIPQFNKNGQKTAEIAAWRGPGHCRFSKADSYHRIEIDPDVDTWTLFVPGPKQRDWGFLTRTGWIESEQYLAQRAQQ